MFPRRRFLTLSATGAAGLVTAPLLSTSASAATHGLLPLAPKAPVLIFGDSYVEGGGADKPTDAWAYKVGAPLGWTVTVAGKGGSGYCNPTTYNAGVYFDRLQKYTDAYDLIVLQGSTNDDKSSGSVYTWDDATLSDAIIKVLDFARTRFTRAQVVMMGGTSCYGNAPTRANGLLAHAAAARSIPFINPIGEKWFMPGDGALFANAAAGHPNNAGYALMRSLFVRDIQALMGS